MGERMRKGADLDSSHACYSRINDVSELPLQKWTNLYLELALSLLEVWRMVDGETHSD